MPEANVISRYQCANVNADSREDHNHANKCDFFKENLEYKKDWTAEHGPWEKTTLADSGKCVAKPLAENPTKIENTTIKK